MAHLARNASLIEILEPLEISGFDHFNAHVEIVVRTTWSRNYSTVEKRVYEMEKQRRMECSARYVLFKCSCSRFVSTEDRLGVIGWYLVIEFPMMRLDSLSNNMNGNEGEGCDGELCRTRVHFFEKLLT